MKRRLLASLLTLVMMLSLLPTMALALDEDPSQKPAVEEPDTGLNEGLQARINTLPNAAALAEMDEDALKAVYNEVQTIYDALDALSTEEVEALELTPLETAAAFFTEQVAPLDVSADIVVSENATWNTATTLTENLIVNSGVTLTIGAQVTISGNVTVSGGGTIKRASAYTGSLLVVTDGSALTLANITIDGGAIWTGDANETLKRGTVNSGLTADSALVVVNGGTLTLNGGAVIQNNERTVGTDVDAWIEWTRPVAQTVRYYAVGGGVSVVGGSLIVNDGAVVKNNTIKDSEKVNEATSDAMGGGIGLYDCASLVVNGGEISGNQAQTSGTARAMGGGIGMAAHSGSLYGSCKVRFKGGELKNNLSVTSGGGAYFTSDCENETGINALDVSFSGGTISENKADAGGGIIVWGGKAALSGTVAFTSNQAPDGNGGGAYFSTRTIVSIDGGTYSNNTSKYGGGIAWNGVKFEFRNGTISNNSVATTGGGLRLSNNTAETSAVISGGKISENTATGGAGVWADYVTISGGTISQNHADGNGQSGGGVYVNHIFKLSGTGTITENSAYTGGGVHIGNQADSSFEITGGTISKNKATGSTGGGGIYSAKVTSTDDVASCMTGGSITENVAETGSGGGLYLRGKFELKGGTISKNSAPLLAGGGVNVHSSAEMVITDGTISNNEANEAAGIRVAGTVTMNGGTVKENCAKPIYDVTTQKEKENNNGGGVSVGRDATFIMNAGLIQNNTAKYGAGISAWRAKQFEIHGGEISGNRTEDMTYSKGGAQEKTVNGTYGAGINLGGNTTLLITGGKIINNVANLYGGGINVPTTEKLQISGTPIITENETQGMQDNVYLRSSNNGKALIELKGNLNSGSTVGVKTEQTPTSSANTIIQITTAETDTAYYKDAARYFIPDAAKVIAQANESGKYVELAYTADDYYKVTLDLSHASATGGAIAMIKKDASYAAAVTADTGYTLPVEKPNGLDTYDRGTGNQFASIGINAVAGNTAIKIDAVPNTYTVAFDGNGSTGGSMTAQDMTYDVAADLTKNEFVNTGYNFAGWSTTKNGSCEYPDKASVKNLTAENGGTVTLYAIWTEKTEIPKFDDGDTAIQSHKYDGSAKKYALTSELEKFTITYKQGEAEVAEPTDVGTYDVIISRAEDATYAAFSQRITGGLVITAADYPVTVQADKTSMTGSGTVKLTVSSSVAGITVTGITCSDSGIVVAKNTDDTYSATLPNETKTYTFTAVVEGVSANYGNGPATCTVSVTRRSSGGGSSSGSGRSYAVTAPSAKNGDVTVSPKNASKGDRVTITVTPDKGYELDKLTVKGASGNKLKLTDKGNGKYTFTMPGSKVTVSAEFVEEQAASIFADVPADAYYAKAVEWAVKKGITNGKANGLFGSNDPCTRGQIVTFLWRAAGSPAPKGTAKVPGDVLPGSYCYDAVAWALENGITNGLADGTFGVNNTCTRGQSVTFLYRTMGTAPTTVNGFTDVAAGDFYAEAVAWAVENGVTNGTTDSTFSPSNGCTRAQIVTFLFRAYNK